MQASAEQNAALQSLQGGASGADAISAVDQLFASTNGALKLLAALEDAGRVSSGIRPMATQRADWHPVPMSFAICSPASRPNRGSGAPKLGANPDIEKLLAMQGNADHGRRVFFEISGGLCSRCHIIANQGHDFGPNLSQIGAKYNKADILDNILHPSKTILAGYETYVVRTKGGDSLSGFLVSKNDSEIVLKTQDLKLVHVKTDRIELMVQQTVSA